MSKTAFAQTIIDKLMGSIGNNGGDYTQGSAPSAMAAVAEAITEYLIANTKVDVAYTGMLTTTPPSPDPVVKDTFEIVGACAPTGVCQHFDDWIRQVESNIIAGFQIAPMGEQGVSAQLIPFINPGISVNRERLKSIHEVGDTSPQSKVWEEICQSIMDWINGPAMNPAPGPANRANGPSTGTANIVKITVS